MRKVALCVERTNAVLPTLSNFFLDLLVDRRTRPICISVAIIIGGWRSALSLVGRLELAGLGLFRRHYVDNYWLRGLRAHKTDHKDTYDLLRAQRYHLVPVDCRHRS